MISPLRFSSVIAHARLASSLVAIGVLGLANSLSAQIRVVNAGDSITAGAGASTLSRSYPSLLANLLGSGYVVRGEGTGGSTLLSNGTLPYVDTETYTASLAANPNIVTILLGIAGIAVAAAAAVGIGRAVSGGGGEPTSRVPAPASDAQLPQQLDGLDQAITGITAH